ncbi:MAG TPA: hypothetical protein VJH20_04165 [Candidatus Nanoarchaeia archaeon]|nr:hypothetical protein [Candidatus Nanoarchaeia archaeon]
MNFKPLNSKEKENVLKLIKKQFSIEELHLDYIFFSNEDHKIFIINKDISKINLSNLRINNIGLYFGKIEDDGFRLSIEGSQIIGSLALNNITEIDDIDTKKWFLGEDIVTKVDNVPGYVILRNKNDFLGCGKIKNNKIINYIDKGRRIRTSDILYLNK